MGSKTYTCDNLASILKKNDELVLKIIKDEKLLVGNEISLLDVGYLCVYLKTAYRIVKKSLDRLFSDIEISSKLKSSRIICDEKTLKLLVTLGFPMSKIKDLGRTYGLKDINLFMIPNKAKDHSKNEALSYLKSQSKNEKNCKQKYYMLVSDLTGLTFSEVKALANQKNTLAYYTYEKKSDKKAKLKKEVAKRRIAGESVSKIAKEYGITTATVRNYVHEYNQLTSVSEEAK